MSDDYDAIYDHTQLCRQVDNASTTIARLTRQVTDLTAERDAAMRDAGRLVEGAHRNMDEARARLTITEGLLREYVGPEYTPDMFARVSAYFHRVDASPNESGCICRTSSPNPDHHASVCPIYKAWRAVPPSASPPPDGPEARRVARIARTRSLLKP